MGHYIKVSIAALYFWWACLVPAKASDSGERSEGLTWFWLTYTARWWYVVAEVFREVDIFEKRAELRRKNDVTKREQERAASLDKLDGCRRKRITLKRELTEN